MILGSPMVEKVQLLLRGRPAREPSPVVPRIECIIGHEMLANRLRLRRSDEVRVNHPPADLAIECGTLLEDQHVVVRTGTDESAPHGIPDTGHVFPIAPTPNRIGVVRRRQVRAIVRAVGSAVQYQTNEPGAGSTREVAIVGTDVVTPLLERFRLGSVTSEWIAVDVVPVSVVDAVTA